MRKIVILLCIVTLGGIAPLRAQTKPAAKRGYQFTDTKVMPCTPVKDQAMSGTCWAFSGLSFLESEAMRAGKEAVDLAPMWVVRNAYIEKAIKYVRMCGTITFSPGGAVLDVFDIVRKYGIVPMEVYQGLNYGTTEHRHSELHSALKGYVAAIARNPNRSISTAWLDGFIGILDAYLGPAPEKFVYKGTEYTPQTFAASLGLDMDDYISLTSFTHHPFYTTFPIEVEDNWSWGYSYNLPLEEFVPVLSGAVDKGYTIYWDSDATEGGFASTKGYAVIRAITIDNVEEKDRERWLAMNPVEQRMFISNQGRCPWKEVEVTQEMRQKAFDSQATSDDHGMHIIGKAVDQTGSEFFKVKNSWGTNGQDYGGYFYASRPYVTYKTICAVVNRNAVPKEILKKFDRKK